MSICLHSLPSPGTPKWRPFSVFRFRLHIFVFSMVMMSTAMGLLVSASMSREAKKLLKEQKKCAGRKSTSRQQLTHTKATFTDSELSKFATRYENGYDITTDEHYNLWLQVFHTHHSGTDASGSSKWIIMVHACSLTHTHTHTHTHTCTQVAVCSLTIFIVQGRRLLLLWNLRWAPLAEEAEGLWSPHVVVPGPHSEPQRAHLLQRRRLVLGGRMSQPQITVERHSCTYTDMHTHTHAHTHTHTHIQIAVCSLSIFIVQGRRPLLLWNLRWAPRAEEAEGLWSLHVVVPARATFTVCQRRLKSDCPELTIAFVCNVWLAVSVCMSNLLMAIKTPDWVRARCQPAIAHALYIVRACVCMHAAPPHARATARIGLERSTLAYALITCAAAMYLAP